jgi:hypothetical protein
LGGHATRAVAACLYMRPGTRSYGGLRTEYLPDGWRRELLCVAVTETATGVANANGIGPPLTAESRPGVTGSRLLT